MFVTTALFNQLARETPEIFQPIRQLLFGGEAANVACVRSVLSAGPPRRLLHVYGPTETTTFATWHEARAVEMNANSIPIGRPIQNTELYVLDDHRELVPVGVIGELYIGGDGLAEGYLNQPELTASKFLVHTWPDGKMTRLYRTGDLVRYHPDGNVNFIGRADSQVKLRGFRIELAEIETIINQHPRVETCAVVLTRDADGEGRLAAYVVGDETGNLKDDLREFLRGKLPDFMLPSAFVFLSALPLNANGKVDRKHLPPPGPVTPTPHPAVVPRDATEAILTQIWKELLNVPSVGTRDNFFELGGHSLLVLRLLARIEKSFGKALPVATVFQVPTVEGLARFLREEPREQGVRSRSIVPIQPMGSRPPLMLVHGAGGGMFWGYANLAELLGNDQPVYGFKAAEVSEVTDGTTIEAMAADFVGQLRAFQPHGPYYLGGYCFGGNVAYEMARQLVSQGQEVALLALMNSTPTETRSHGDAIGWRRFGRGLGNIYYQFASFIRRNRTEQRRILGRRWRSLNRVVFRRRQDPAPDRSLDELVDLSSYSPEERRFWEAHIGALARHHTQPYSGKVTLLRSRGYHSGCSLDSSYGWREYVTDTVVQIVPGAHEQILEKPFVKELAKELQKCLAAAQESAAAAAVAKHRHSEEIVDPTTNAGLIARLIDTQAVFPRDKCVHQLFEDQATRTPTAPAVLFGNAIIQYRELNAWADQIARRLGALGVGPDVPVGLCVERSPSMVASVLGILKAGGAYVPMDPAYPRERLQLMLENARVPVLITSAELSSGFELSKLSCAVLDVAECMPEVRESPEGRGIQADSSVRPEHLAYVIHTSGSTGVPKGVAMPHRPLVNLLAWQLRNSALAPGARTLQFSSLSFDVSFQEMFSTWSAGGTLVLIDDALRRDPFALLRFLSVQKIERLFLPFVALQQLAEAYSEEDAPPANLREVITAGEQLQITPGIVRLFSRLPHCTLDNQYGPTESHVVTAFSLTGSPQEWPSLPPIGRPIANTQIHLLSPDGQPVAVGAEGELFIAGECLARGYLHRPDLTAERFVPNPFSNDPKARMYKTGDRARWLPDGNIEYLGRLDQQVKIRGYRIELNEVEAALAQHPSVRECAAAACDGGAGSKRLAAYVVTQEAMADGPAPDFRSFLSQRLPEYMVPSAFVLLDALPLTPSGKVDRRALPAPGPTQVTGSEPGVAPRNVTEEKLATIWRETLSLEHVGVEQNFFELGGHSLLAVQVIVKVKQVFRRELPVTAVFQNPTIEKLSRILSGGSELASRETSIVEIQPKGTQPPLFLVHGAGGGMFWGYANLARHLGDDQPVLAFNSRGLDGGSEYETIEAMAAAYVADLLAFQPHGPYRLGGYCFGGNVAYEMARQLEAEGETVALLAVFNGWPSNSSYSRPRLTPTICLRFFRNLRYWGTYVLQLKPHQQRELLLWKAQAVGRRWLRLMSHLRTTTPDIDVAEWVDLAAQPKDRHNLWGSHIRAYLEYRAQPIRGHLVLFRTKCHPLVCSFDEACGWRELAGGGVSVHVVPGAHESILDEPHVEALAAELGQELAASLDRDSKMHSTDAEDELPVETHQRWVGNTALHPDQASLTEHRP